VKYLGFILWHAALNHGGGDLQHNEMQKTRNLSWSQIDFSVPQVLLCMRAGAHEQYLDCITRGAMLERGDGELQRELSQLLLALVQLQPLLRNLQQEVCPQLCREPMPHLAMHNHVGFCGQAVVLLSALMQPVLRNLQPKGKPLDGAGAWSLMSREDVLCCACFCGLQWRCPS
jgi:hypothetical protein